MKKLLLITILTLVVATQSSKTHASTLLASSAAPLGLYMIGLGSSFVVEWLMDTTTQTLSPDGNKERPRDYKNQQVEELLQEAHSTSAKSIKHALYTALRLYIQELLNAVPTLSAQTKATLLQSYDAGGMIDYVRYAASRGIDFIKSFTQLIIETGLQIGSLSKSGLEFQLAQITQKLFKPITPTAYRFDAGYPLAARAGTALTCGPQDRYCTQTVIQSEKELITPELKELTETAEKYVLNSLRLMLQAGTLTAGIAFAYISFEVGLAVSQFLINSTLPESALKPALRIIAQKTIARAVETTTAERLKNWFVKLLEKTKLLEQEGGFQADLLIPTEMHTILKTAQQGVILKEAALPSQKVALEQLLTLINSISTIIR